MGNSEGSACKEKFSGYIDFGIGAKKIRHSEWSFQHKGNTRVFRVYNGLGEKQVK